MCGRSRVGHERTFPRRSFHRSLAASRAIYPQLAPMMRRPFDRVRWVFFDLGSTLIDDTCARRFLLTQIAQRLRQEGIVAQPSELERSLRTAFTRFLPAPWEHVLTELVRD